MAIQTPAGGHRDRTRAQMWAEQGLAPHPYRLELQGSPSDLVWPQICAHCGTPASERITVDKVFRPLPRRRGGSAPYGLRAYRINSVSIPFCGTCAAAHHAAVQRPSTAKKALRLVFHPLIIPVAGFAWLTSIFLREFSSNPIADTGPVPEWAILAALFAALAWCVFLLWQTTAPTRIDPQTDITRSCDFSEDVSGVLEGERRIYSLRNKEFSDAMAALNATRGWTADDQARSLKKGFWFGVLAIAVLVALVGLLKLLGY